MFQICTFFLLLTSTFQLCDSNFCSCTNQICTSCLTTSMYSINSTCLPCPYQCSTCTAKNLCTSCVGSYYLANNNCIACGKYCSICNNQACLKCMDGYGLTIGTCVACSIKNALSCEGSDILVSCVSGYWQNGNSCSPCRQFCLTCSSPSNCLQCQTGYQVAVSFGSYCSKCPSGCSSCSSSLCTSCFYNYYLSNGACINITANCSSIENCQYCQLGNTGVSCYSCYYPYYMSGGVCLMGASMMCRNGAGGPMFYQCLNGCASLAFEAGSSKVGAECVAQPWLGFIQQIYLNVYDSMFAQLYQMGGEWIYFDSQLSTNSKTTVSIQLALAPYYKLAFSLKMIATGQISQNLTTAVILTDNASNIENYTFSQLFSSNTQAVYVSFTTKAISEQAVNFTVNWSGSSTVVAGLAELLVQVYGCPANCRLCFNAELCSQCYPNYFSTPDYQCVTSCVGYLQLYMPSGISSNYTYKQCVASCASSFYPSTQNNIYTCLKCVGPCLTCLSPTQCLTCLPPLLYYQINFTCLNSCPITHYSTSNMCTPCSIPCATCSSSSNCLSCSVGYFSNGICLTTCPQGTFQDNINNLCKSCDAKCFSCEGSPNYCLSCNSPYLLFGSSCLSTCLSSLYYVQSNSCKMCTSPCLQCLNKTSCISCISGFFYQSSCLSTCPQGYFADSSDLVCKICQNGCLTCLSQAICLSCPNSTYLYSYSCVSICVSGTYSSSGICMSCIQPCSSCMNTTFCLTCSIGYLSQLALGSCLSSCQPGYYAQTNTLTCLKCSDSCKKCSGQATSCLSCSNNLLLLGQSCVLSCSKGYYSNLGVCIGCAFPCASCEMTEYNCTSCQTEYIWVNYDCITDCPVYTYLNNSTCLTCLYPCLTCSAANLCLTCAVNSSAQSYLIGSQCLTSCPQGYYADNTTLSCVNCRYPCNNCISQSSCISCSFGYLNLQTSSCGLCQANMFVNQSTKVCQLCNSSMAGCTNCLSSYECILCQSRLYLFKGLCISQQNCNDKLYYYIDNQLSQCLACVYPCTTCLNATYCSSCSSGYLWMGTCLGTCLAGYYQNQAICSPCASICLTCSNLTACLSCNTSSTLNIYFSEQYICISAASCMPGYYIDSTYGPLLCSKCISPCLSCLNSSYCVSCLFGINYKGSCKSNCPTGFFTDSSNSTNIKCSPCSVTCFSCVSSANNCSSCFSSFYLKNATCVSSCGEAFYLDSTIFKCFSCIAPCYNCSSAALCLSCINNSYILYYGQCLTVCPDGTYNSNQTCLPCPPTCLTCHLTNSIPSCNLCINSMFMSMSQAGRCLSSCQSNQYGDNSTRNCYSCVAPCFSCTSAISCLSCIDSYLLYQTQCLAISRCPNGSFLQGRSCLRSCGMQWAVQFSAICSDQCYSPALKLVTMTAKQCVLSCPTNYFLDENYTCSPCVDTVCDALLTVTIEVKNIFNVLYAKITFNKNLNLSLISQKTVKIYVSSLQSSSRLLTQSQIQFQVSTINLNAVWLKLAIIQSIKNSLISLEFNDYYALGAPLQGLSFRTKEVVSFDLYSSEQEDMGQFFQKLSEVLSLIMIVIFIADLTLNSGHLSYLIVDYYQLLFMVLFLSIDYPPHLNHFLYGFRYSHYLFLPQIFRTSPSKEYSSYTPDKFGVVVPDVYFLGNTGHTFLIIGSALGVLGLSKLVEVCIRKFQECKSNRVGDSAMEKDQEKQSKLVLFLQGIVSRFKWNYFNDTIYTIYFSLMLFAFSQLYDLTWRDNAIFDLLSISLAFLFIIVGCLFPFFLGWFLQRQKDNLIQHSLQHEKEILKSKLRTVHKDKENLLDEKEDMKQKSSKVSSYEENQNQQSKNYEILTDFKCFVSGIKLKVKMGFYHIPIRYAKKLIFACLLVYCSQYPSLVLGVVMMSCFIDILVALTLKPYRLSFEQIIYPIFDGLYFLLFFTICVMQLPILNLSQTQKLSTSYLAISICVLLSILLAIHNIAMNVLEIIKYFCKLDYLSKYYQTEYVETTEDGLMSEHEYTHSPLIKQPLKEDSIKLEKQETSSMISGLDIYLKKQHNAPQYLIKCLKQEQVEEVMKEEGDRGIKEEKIGAEKLQAFDLNLDQNSWKEQDGSRESKGSRNISENEAENRQLNLQRSNIFENLKPLDFEEFSENK